MNKEELENYIKTSVPKLIIDKEICKTVSAYGSIDVDELTNVIDRLKKVPNYDELLKENNRLNKALLDIKEHIETNWAMNEKEQVYLYETIQGKEILDIVNKSLGSDKE